MDVGVPLPRAHRRPPPLLAVPALVRRPSMVDLGGAFRRARRGRRMTQEWEEG